jgi:alkylation response protein AidB-like acyl-CoA dehydrogenase
VAARHRRGDDAGGLRDHRAGRRLELPRDLDDREALGRRLRAQRQKTYISGVEDAQAILVVARHKLDDGTLGLPMLCLVDSDAPGLERQYIPTALRGADKQWQLFLDNVEIPADRLVGSETAGLKAAFDGLNPERIMGAAIALGVGDRALRMASAYARERTVWRGAPIGSHQGIAHPLAEAKIELELARTMTAKAAALHDAGAPSGEVSNIAKYAAAEAAIKCVDQAIQTHGGNGFALEYGLTDMYWGARLARTAPVSREMILNYVPSTRSACRAPTRRRAPRSPGRTSRRSACA